MSDSSSRNIAERELQRFRKLLLAVRVLAKLRIGERQQVLIWAGLVGIGGALAGQLFKEGTFLVLWLLCGRTGGFVATFSELPLWQRIVVPTVGGLLAGLVLVNLPFAAVGGVLALWLRGLHLSVSASIGEPG